jgi:hypothetical protein
MKAFLRCGIAEWAMRVFFDNLTRNGVMERWSFGVLVFAFLPRLTPSGRAVHAMSRTEIKPELNRN